MKGFEVAKRLPHRLEDYKYHFCFDRRHRIGLEIVLDVRALMTSFVSTGNIFFVKSIKGGEILERAYYGNEIALLEPVDTPVDPIDIELELNELNELVEQALQDKIELGWTEYDFLAPEYDRFFENVPALFRANGHSEQEADLLRCMHVLETRIP